mmetsp:Transcript_15706/g.18145  ORF Transcript_15706/g.18145 Transcript_15706/m.18145 type:complete len:103 (-) Transcript_15706:57-365(-)
MSYGNQKTNDLSQSPAHADEQSEIALPPFLFDRKERKSVEKRNLSPGFPYLKRVYLYHMHDTQNQRMLITRFIQIQMLEEFRTGDFKWKREHVYDFNFTVEL